MLAVSSLLRRSSISRGFPTRVSLIPPRSSPWSITLDGSTSSSERRTQASSTQALPLAKVPRAPRKTRFHPGPTWRLTMSSVQIVSLKPLTTLTGLLRLIMLSVQAQSKARTTKQKWTKRRWPLTLSRLLAMTVRIRWSTQRWPSRTPSVHQDASIQA